MVQRKEYLEQLLAWKDDRVIKVVTGMRRSGKSTLLEQFQSLLLQHGVEPSQIISVNFEELEYEHLLDYRSLYAYLMERIDTTRKNYVFLDEVQLVAFYEKVVDSLYAKDYVDIYITGSNSYMLSSDLATLLSGRYVEVKMLPLSFREFCQASGYMVDESSGANGIERDTSGIFASGTSNGSASEAATWTSAAVSADQAFAEYMKVGGLPYVVTMDRRAEKLDMYLEGIYNTVIVRDIEERQSRRARLAAQGAGNQAAGGVNRKITDLALLKNITRFLASTIGSPVSIKSITDYLVSNGRKVSPNTVENCVSVLCEAFVFYKVERFDVVGKELLKSNGKLYMVDLGLRNYVLPKKRYDLGFSIENVVYFELLRRGYRVNVGKLGSAEVDFVARKGDATMYVQVTADMVAESTFEREMKPLGQIRDNHMKMVLTLDRITPGNYEGIQVVNVVDWLLGE